MELNAGEIKDLAEAVGLVVEPHDYELEEEMIIIGCPSAGIRDDAGKVTHYKHVAYFSEYPDEGAFPLGNEINPDVVSKETQSSAWLPIDIAPRDRPILIRARKNYQPDLVRWRCRQPERMVGKTQYLAVLAGWFRLSGGRSHIYEPTEWTDIPE